MRHGIAMLVWSLKSERCRVSIRAIVTVRLTLTFVLPCFIFFRDLLYNFHLLWLFITETFVNYFYKLNTRFYLFIGFEDF